MGWGILDWKMVDRSWADEIESLVLPQMQGHNDMFIEFGRVKRSNGQNEAVHSPSIVPPVFVVLSTTSTTGRKMVCCGRVAKWASAVSELCT